MIRRQDALDYHREGRPGKVEIHPTKPSHTQRDLSLAYSPGVAEPCREIARTPEDSFVYTARGNLVAVVTNGTAVLGLGDIGPIAAKPVMEGKALLFKRFADIDVFDIEVACDDIDEFCRVVRALEPTFGGINLEDIKSPECFEIERRLTESMDIPVFHDDQHGTAIISAAAFLNWVELTGRRPEDTRIVFSGAGAAALSCARMFLLMGACEDNLLVCDSRGVLTLARCDELNEYKRPFARDTGITSLDEALRGADVFAGLSVGGIVTADMVRSMADAPLIMALANPDPEIPYEEAHAARPDAIVCTGRSDFPNQVNNVLGFPYLFRGALDVRARKIDGAMKVAAVHALAELARRPVPESVSRAYGGKRFEFGAEYVIPSPMDPRVLTSVAPAVARAACESGVARHPITDWDGYVESLDERLGRHTEVLRFATQKARQAMRRIVFPDGEQDRVLRAAAQLVEERLAEPVLVGEAARVRAQIAALDLGEVLGSAEIHEPARSPHYEDYWRRYWEMRERRGVSRFLARRDMTASFPFASMMLHSGHADAMVAGLGAAFSEMLQPVFSIVGCADGYSRAAGVHLVMRRNELYFFADTTAQIEPTSENIAEVAHATAELARHFLVEPRIAMLSFSNFGSVDHDEARRMRRAVELVRERSPDLVVDGEMQADTALMPDFRKDHFPFSKLDGRANVLIFPSLAAGNIAFKIAHCMGASMVLGPFLVGLARPVAMLNRYAGVSEILQSAIITSIVATAPEVVRPGPDLS